MENFISDEFYFDNPINLTALSAVLRRNHQNS